VRGTGGWIVAPGSVRSDGKVYAEQSGVPSLVEAFQSGAIPVIPAHVVELIAQKPKHNRANSDPPAPDEVVRLRDRIMPLMHNATGSRETAYAPIRPDIIFGNDSHLGAGSGRPTLFFLDFQHQRALKPARCQRSTVSG
jgi:hypothetical protein